MRRGPGFDQSAPTDASAHPSGWEQTRGEQGDPRARASVRGVLKELLETAIFILLVFLIVRGVIQNFKIEGQSMEPNLHTGQYILVNKIVYFHFDLNAPLRLLPGNADLPAKVVYPFHMPRRGEVVVFEYPRDMSKDYIKRVIGLPGETVLVKDGQVFIDSQPLDEAYLKGLQTNCRGDDPCNFGQPVTVPAGTVFVMGDNRNNSSDSREWGALPLDGIIGKAWVSYWPRSYWGVIPSATYAALP
ncbi:MAG TPA: signal peptidase I [Kouleothrix sp.]|uniref:signal peptidase I n=1 Tax=Kouleothrix sp. TaxID=2779161 RepID=UPI002CAE42BB|nr:signal peptidase I [Kouleothrix sp.]HRC75919.1 signal peptidase I [Kouleothrix sp.]